MFRRNRVLDELVAIQANLDQAQAMIDVARSECKNDEHLMHQLDRHQIRLNTLRSDIAEALLQAKTL